MKVSYFPGCTLKNKAKDLDAYAYRSAEALGVTLIKLLTGAGQAAERHLSRGCVGAFPSADWTLVKWLTGTDEVVDQALNDQQSRK